VPGRGFFLPQTVLVGALFMMLAGGCTLQEIRSTTDGGPEWRTKGAGASKSHSVRWSVSQGLDFKWDNGVDTGVKFRRRDEEEGAGEEDNGLFFEVSFPLWKKPQAPPGPNDARVEELERRVAELEARLSQEEAP
jgi:hypothetical protein